MPGLKGYSGLKKVRGGFGFWRWLHIRICKKCGNEHHILGNDTRIRPSLPPGGFYCAKCGELVIL